METIHSGEKSITTLLVMKILRTEYAALVGILLILLATVKHAFEVYTSVMYIDTEPTLWQNIYIAVMLVAIDFAVILFTIHGNSYAAQTFAFMIFLVNLFAFWQEVPWQGWEIRSMVNFIPGFLFSGMFAYGLYYFTDLFSDLLREENRLGELQEELVQAMENISSLKEEITTHKSSIAEISLEKESLLRQLSQVEESKRNVDGILEKAENFDLLLRYVIETEGYSDKTPEALRKGVEYWRRKAEGTDLDIKNQVKLLAYKGAYLKVLPEISSGFD